MLQTNELKKLRKEAGEGSAHLFGSEHKSLNSVVKSTYKQIKNNNRNFGQTMDASVTEGPGGLHEMTNAYQAGQDIPDRLNSASSVGLGSAAGGQGAGNSGIGTPMGSQNL